MIQLEHKQNKKLTNFFHNAVVGHYLNPADIWDMQLDALAATGAITYEQATNTASFHLYRQYERGLIDSYQYALDTMWTATQYGLWRKPDDTAIQAVVKSATARCKEYLPSKLGSSAGVKLPRLVQPVFPLINTILDHDGGPELKESNDYQGFLDAKKTAYAPYKSPEAFNKDVNGCGDALAHNMVMFLKKGEEDNARLAMCVMDWAYVAFAMWHAGQYRYQRIKKIKEYLTGQHRKEMTNLVNHAAHEVFSIVYTIPVDLMSYQGTVSDALDRFMAAYSTGEFPLDFTCDKIHVDMSASEQLPKELRGCIEKGTRSSYEWRRAFFAVSDRWKSKHYRQYITVQQEGQQEHE